MIRPVPGLSVEQQPERVIIRFLPYGEARNQSDDGVLAVLHVLNNRALKHDTSWKHEALRPLQFSCFNADDPNRAKLLTAWEDDPKTWERIDQLVLKFEQGDTVDDTLGSLNYYVTDMPHPPSWSKPEAGWKLHAVIGSHSFGEAA